MERKRDQKTGKIKDTILARGFIQMLTLDHFIVLTMINKILPCGKPSIYLFIRVYFPAGFLLELYKNTDVMGVTPCPHELEDPVYALQITKNTITPGVAAILNLHDLGILERINRDSSFGKCTFTVWCKHILGYFDSLILAEIKKIFPDWEEPERVTLPHMTVTSAFGDQRQVQVGHEQDGNEHRVDVHEQHGPMRQLQLDVEQAEQDDRGVAPDQGEHQQREERMEKDKVSANCSTVQYVCRICKTANFFSVQETQTEPENTVGSSQTSNCIRYFR